MRLMPPWIDPRSLPSPPFQGPRHPLAAASDALDDLLQFCRDGRLYAVERWIADDKPLQAAPPEKGRAPETALEIALATGNHALAHLLLCNGYRPDLDRRSPYALVLSRDRRHLLDLLWAWAVPVAGVDPEDVMSTYETDLLERFYQAGLDFTDRHALAYALAHTSNKPLFGFTRRHRGEHPTIQRDLDIALGHHIEQRHDKGISLCLWAGADPHQPVPDLGELRNSNPFELSAISRAVWKGTPPLVELLRPDPARDDVEDLYVWAQRPEILDVLHRIAPPASWSPIIIRHISRLSWPYAAAHDSLSCLIRIGELQGRLDTVDDAACRSLRRDLARLGPDLMRRVMRWLGDPARCAPEVYQRLVATPAMQHRLRVAGIGQPRPRRRAASPTPP